MQVFYTILPIILVFFALLFTRSMMFSLFILVGVVMGLSMLLFQ